MREGFDATRAVAGGAQPGIAIVSFAGPIIMRTLVGVRDLANSFDVLDAV